MRYQVLLSSRNRVDLIFISFCDHHVSRWANQKPVKPWFMSWRTFLFTSFKVYAHRGSYSVHYRGAVYVGYDINKTDHCKYITQICGASWWPPGLLWYTSSRNHEAFKCCPGVWSCVIYTNCSLTSVPSQEHSWRDGKRQYIWKARHPF